MLTDEMEASLQIMLQRVWDGYAKPLMDDLYRDACLNLIAELIEMEGERVHVQD